MSVEAVIKAAAGEAGYRESGTNLTKFNQWLGRIPGYPHNGYGYPWCHSFVSWALATGGEAKAGPRTAGCEVGVAWFKARDKFSKTPKVGDFVYYGPGGGTHVELVVAVTASTITTVGGNTSGSLGGRYFNGNGVYRKVVARSSSRIYGYGHPAYVGAPPTPQPAPQPEPAPKPVKQAPTFPGPVLKHPPLLKTNCARRWQQRMRERGWILDVDGYYGPESAGVCRKFQRDKGLVVDGQVGPKTWAAAWTAPIT